MKQKLLTTVSVLVTALLPAFPTHVHSA